MVIMFNINYNLLLVCEWIHGIGVVPLNLQQRVAIWEDGIVENIEVGQIYYKVEVSKVGKKDFDRNLAKIPPFYAFEEVYTP